VAAKKRRAATEAGQAGEGGQGVAAEVGQGAWPELRHHAHRKGLSRVQHQTLHRVCWIMCDDKHTSHLPEQTDRLGEPEVGRENQLNLYTSRLYTSRPHTPPLHTSRACDLGRLQGRPVGGGKRSSSSPGIGGVEAVMLLQILRRWASAAARGAFASTCTQQV
jgi:hypothetical protein